MRRGLRKKNWKKKEKKVKKALIKEFLKGWKRREG